MDSERLKRERLSTLAMRLWEGELSTDDKAAVDRVLRALIVPDSVEVCEREIGEPHGIRVHDYGTYALKSESFFYDEITRPGSRLRAAQRACRHARIEVLWSS